MGTKPAILMGFVSVRLLLDDEGKDVLCMIVGYFWSTCILSCMSFLFLKPYVCFFSFKLCFCVYFHSEAVLFFLLNYAFVFTCTINVIYLPIFIFGAQLSLLQTIS